MNSKFFWKLSCGLVILLVLTALAKAQDPPTKTKVIENPDGTYTVIEYPVDKEVTVELKPITIEGATGTAHVLRTADGTTIRMDLANISGDTNSYYVYTVDPAGVPTFLGPLTITEGKAQATFKTPMNRFMLVVSPLEGLKTIEPETSVVFRSTVPAGYAVVPIAREDDDEQIATSTKVTSTYEVPILNISSLGEEETQIDITFSGELQGLKGKAYLDQEKAGVTKIKLRFDDMKMAPKDKRFILWAASPDRKYTKLGQVINTGKRQESEIRSETAMKDFGLFVTMEDTDVTQPKSRVYTVFSIP